MNTDILATGLFSCPQHNKNYLNNLCSGGMERWSGVSTGQPNKYQRLRRADTITDQARQRGVDPLSPPGSTFHVKHQRLAHKRARSKRFSAHKRQPSAQASHLAHFILATLALIVVLFASSTAAAYAYYQTHLPILKEIASHNLTQTTRIYDRHGNLLYEAYDQQKGRRTYVSYKEISPQLVNATIAVEDRTFWTNAGVDFYGIARAALSDAQSDQVVEGGSTITQQLIKNQFFVGQPRTLQVKSDEALLAMGLTQQYPKWKIMEMYLNTVFYGDQNYGVEAAAENFFGMKPGCNHGHCIPAVSRLTLGEAALLAGMPQSPTYYNPIYNKRAALQRQAVVLHDMLNLHMITSQQMHTAQAEMARFIFKPYAATHKIQAPHFVWYVINQVEQEIGAPALFDGGLSIYTTLDLTLEKQVEQIVYNDLYKAQQDNYMGYYGPLNITNNVHNAAVVVMNPTTGEILAMDGSANYYDNSPQVQGQYNTAVDAERQPGSAFKPVVYATAFEMGWYPAMILPDHRTIYPGNAYPPYYTPHNYDNLYHTGYPMTIRTAIANSFNIPAVDAILFAGTGNVVNMAERLGLSEIGDVPQNQLGPAMALGSLGVSLLHLTGAYATFANQGVRVPPISILSIKDNEGRTIYRYNETNPPGVQVIRKDVAFLVNSILSDKSARYHEFGPGNPLELDRPAAAKTGTTDSFRDNWTMGYTPYLTTGVWAGNDDNSAMYNVIGITGAGPIWHDVMEYASRYYHYPPTSFVPPDDVHLGVVSALTGLRPLPGEPIVKDWFIDGTMPTIYGNPHDSYQAGCTWSGCKTPAPTGGTITPVTITPTPFYPNGGFSSHGKSKCRSRHTCRNNSPPFNPY
jgi:membrane peptidoglycan carboxypeptidase